MYPHPSTKPLRWVCSLYFFQSIPFVVVNLIATIIYQQSGLETAKITLFSSLLMLPWAIKPLFAPLLETLETKKRLTIITQFLLSLLFFIVAISTDSIHFLVLSTLVFAFIAFFSSLHDIVSDGVYLVNLTHEEQKRYVATRSFFYQMGRLAIKGVLLSVIARVAANYKISVWAVFFYSLFALSAILAIYHSIVLPEKELVEVSKKKRYRLILKELLSDKIFYAPLIYIFLYNFADAQLQKIIPIFLLDEAGLALNLSEVGDIYGIYGGIALMSGIFVSGFAISRLPLTQCIKKFTTLLFLTPLLFLLLTFIASNLSIIKAVIICYQFALGLANGAYMGYILFVANKSPYPMSMYTICTSAMALSYVFWGALSGVLQQKFGYSLFFVYLLIINGCLLMITYWTMNKDA